MSLRQVVFSSLEGIPEVAPGDCVASLISGALKCHGVRAQEGDALVVAQKIVSKAEGRVVDLRAVEPSVRALEIAAEVEKDPRLVEVILRESVRVVRKGMVSAGRGRIIAETRSGMIMANAGVDLSNTGADGLAVLLPVSADASADAIREKLGRLCGSGAAVIITDTAGRPWREGLVDIAIGCSGMKALSDYRGTGDMRGAELVATEMAVADQIAAGAGILMRKDSGSPVVLAKGAGFEPGGTGAAALIRKRSEDLFR